MVEKPRTSNQPYLVVSTDAHAAPSLEHQLRTYCPSRYLREYDEFVSDYRRATASGDASQKITPFSAESRSYAERLGALATSGMKRQAVIDAMNQSVTCEGYQDPHVRLRHMDEDGVAAEVVFAGGPNTEVLPFLAMGFDQGRAQTPVKLRQVGSHIWNQWLADFISIEPNRHIGVMQIVISDVTAAVSEIEWGYSAGLRAVNLSAPRRDYPPYTDPVYEPLWATCDELGIPILTHAAGGEFPLGTEGPMGQQLYLMETDWLSRRGLWHLIFGGVFERYPRLKFVLTEQRVGWVPDTLRNLDSVYFNDFYETWKVLPRTPSEYWASNCYLAGSFLASFELALLDEVGRTNLMWGSDYPHIEGTWPNTRLSLRNTFAEFPQETARLVLGENALKVYDLDAEALRLIADRVGPTPDELSTPVLPDEFPDVRGLAFRTYGGFA